MKPDFLEYFRPRYNFSTKELISETSFACYSNASSCIFERSVRPWEKKELCISSNYIFGLFMKKKNLVEFSFIEKNHFSMSILSLFHFTFTSRKRVKAFLLCPSRKKWNQKLFTSRIKEKNSHFLLLKLYKHVK